MSIPTKKRQTKSAHREITLSVEQATSLIREIIESAREGLRQESSADIGDFVCEILSKGVPGWDKGKKPPTIVIGSPVTPKAELTMEQKILLVKNFREWAGIGETDAPEDSHQITVYCDYAMDESLEYDAVHEFLTDWLLEGKVN